jgi:hypothetical protein
MSMKLVGMIVVVVLVVWLSLVVTDTRVLVGETLVRPGQVYVAEDHGDLGSSHQKTLVCRYFNGRRILTTVLWYSSNNIMGRDSCPFVRRPND